MIHTYIQLDEKSSLFKNLKKRGVLDCSDRLFIKLEHKPCIGEVICLHQWSVNKEQNLNLYEYLNNRKTPLYFKIMDLCHTPYFLGKSLFNTLSLKCAQGDYKNWK
jgi:hypothetical protein